MFYYFRPLFVKKTALTGPILTGQKGFDFMLKLRREKIKFEHLAKIACPRSVFFDYEDMALT